MAKVNNTGRGGATGSARSKQHPNMVAASAARAAAPEPPPLVESPEDRLNRKIASNRSNNSSGRTVGSGTAPPPPSSSPQRRDNAISRGASSSGRPQVAASQPPPPRSPHVETPEERLGRKLMQERQMKVLSGSGVSGTGRSRPATARPNSARGIGIAGGLDENRTAADNEFRSSTSSSNRRHPHPASTSKQGSSTARRQGPASQDGNMKQKEAQRRQQAMNEKLLQGGKPNGNGNGRVGEKKNIRDRASNRAGTPGNLNNRNRGGGLLGISNIVSTTGASASDMGTEGLPSGRSLGSNSSKKGSTSLLIDADVQVGAIAIAGPDAEEYNGFRPSRYNDDELETVYTRRPRRNPADPRAIDEENSIHNENMREIRPERDTVKVFGMPRRKCIIIAAAVLVVVIGAALGGAAASGAFSNGTGGNPATDDPTSTTSADGNDPPVSIAPTSPMDNIPLECRPQKLPYEETSLKQQSFGTSVAISASNAFVGAHMDSVGRGAIYSFYRGGSDGSMSSTSSPSSWVADFGTIVPDDGALLQGNEFGRSLAASGDILAAGALYMQSNEDRVGCVYTYTRISLGWTQNARIVPDDKDLTDRSFGTSIALDYIGGDGEEKTLTMIVGEPLGGAAYIFSQSDDGTWSQDAKLLPLDRSEEGSSDSFGYQVALHGTFAVISSHKDDTDVGRDSGSIYVYNRGSTTRAWRFMTKLIPDDGGAAFDTFGKSLSIYDGVIAVGADGDDDNGFSSGSVYIFRLNGNTWMQEAKLKPSDGEASKRFGASVAFGEGGFCVVGATGDSNGTGAIYTFQRRGSAWEQQNKMVASGPASIEKFGSSLAVDGASAIVGAFDGGELGNERGDAFTLDLCH